MVPNSVNFYRHIKIYEWGVKTSTMVPNSVNFYRRTKNLRMGSKNQYHGTKFRKFLQIDVLKIYGIWYYDIAHNLVQCCMCTNFHSTLQNELAHICEYTYRADYTYRINI